MPLKLFQLATTEHYDRLQPDLLQLEEPQNFENNL